MPAACGPAPTRAGGRWPKRLAQGLLEIDVYDTFMRPFELNYCVTGRFLGLNRIYDLSVARSRIDVAPRDLLLVDVATTVLGLAVREPPQFIPRHLVTLGITPRETQVLERVACGRSNVEIASDLSVSPGTVKKHLDNIFEKLGVRNRIEAARFWIAQSREPAEVDRTASPLDSDQDRISFGKHEGLRHRR